MKKLWIWTLPFALCLASTPSLAGALLLEIANPSANTEALAQDAAVIARTTACRSPGKTNLTATAEGLVNGVRKSLPLQVSALSAPGTFAVGRQGPEAGTWVIKIVATNPEYKNYATAAIVPVKKGQAYLAGVQRLYHAPSEAEIVKSLN